MAEDKQLEKSPFLREWEKRYRAYQIKENAKQEDTDGQLATSVEKRAGHQSTNLVNTEKHRQPDPVVIPEKQTKEETTDRQKKQLQIRSRISHKTWLRVAPILLGAVLFLLVSVYFISPLSKEKQIVVTGNQTIATDTIIATAQIPKEDYSLTTWLHRSYIARVIKDSQDRISSVNIDYQFPNRFTIAVTEYQIIAYLQQDGHIYPILSNGTISKQVFSGETSSIRTMTINIQDKALLSALVAQLAQVDSTLIQGIQMIDLQPSQVTADLLLIKMYDGNSILIPLSEIAKKLPYYSQISSKLTTASIVDMEAGIFSYPQ